MTFQVPEKFVLRYRRHESVPQYLGSGVTLSANRFVMPNTLTLTVKACSWPEALAGAWLMMTSRDLDPKAWSLTEGGLVIEAE